MNALHFLAAQERANKASLRCLTFTCCMLLLKQSNRAEKDLPNAGSHCNGQKSRELGIQAPPVVAKPKVKAPALSCSFYRTGITFAKGIRSYFTSYTCTMSFQVQYSVLPYKTYCIFFFYRFKIF